MIRADVPSSMIRHLYMAVLTTKADLMETPHYQPVLKPAETLLSRGLQGQDLAVFTVESKWAPNKPLEAKHCYGTTSIEHPAVSMITTERASTTSVCASGPSADRRRPVLR